MIQEGELATFAMIPTRQVKRLKPVVTPKDLPAEDITVTAGRYYSGQWYLVGDINGKPAGEKEIRILRWNKRMYFQICPADTEPKAYWLT